LEEFVISCTMQKGKMAEMQKQNVQQQGFPRGHPP
jgi:hypothetical protein